AAGAKSWPAATTVSNEFWSNVNRGPDLVPGCEPAPTRYNILNRTAHWSVFIVGSPSKSLKVVMAAEIITGIFAKEDPQRRARAPARFLRVFFCEISPVDILCLR